MLGAGTRGPFQPKPFYESRLFHKATNSEFYILFKGLLWAVNIYYIFGIKTNVWIKTDIYTDSLPGLDFFLKEKDVSLLSCFWFFFIFLASDKTFWVLLCHFLTYLQWQLMIVEVTCLMWENTIYSLLSRKEVEDHSYLPRIWCPFSLTSKCFAISQNICSVFVHSGCQVHVQVQGWQHSWISGLFFRQWRIILIFLLNMSDTLMVAMKTFALRVISSVM